MALNYRRLGRTGAALHALLWSTVATVLLIVVCMMIPDEVHIPNAAFLISQIGGMYYTAKSLQGPAIESHQRKGGSLASAWRAAGIGILTGIVVAVVFVGILMVMMPAVEE
jgi:hypothetical protein